MYSNNEDALKLTLKSNEGGSIDSAWRKTFLKSVTKKLGVKDVLNFTEPSGRYGDELFCSYSEKSVIRKAAISIELTNLNYGEREFVFSIVSEFVNFIKKMFYRDAVNLNQVKFFLIMWDNASSVEVFRYATSQLAVARMKELILGHPPSSDSSAKAFLQELYDLKINTGDNVDLFIHISTSDLRNMDAAALVEEEKARVIRKTFKKTLWVNLVSDESKSEAGQAADGNTVSKL